MNTIFRFSSSLLWISLLTACDDAPSSTDLRYPDQESAIEADISQDAKTTTPADSWHHTENQTPDTHTAPPKDDPQHPEERSDAIASAPDLAPNTEITILTDYTPPAERQPETADPDPASSISHHPTDHDHPPQTPITSDHSAPTYQPEAAASQAQSPSPSPSPPTPLITVNTPPATASTSSPSPEMSTALSLPSTSTPAHSSSQNQEASSPSHTIITYLQDYQPPTSHTLSAPTSTTTNDDDTSSPPPASTTTPSQASTNPTKDIQSSADSTEDSSHPASSTATATATIHTLPPPKHTPAPQGPQLALESPTETPQTASPPASSSPAPTYDAEEEAEFMQEVLDLARDEIASSESPASEHSTDPAAQLEKKDPVLTAYIPPAEIYREPFVYTPGPGNQCGHVYPSMLKVTTPILSTVVSLDESQVQDYAAKQVVVGTKKMLENMMLNHEHPIHPVAFFATIKHFESGSNISQWGYWDFGLYSPYCSSGVCSGFFQVDVHLEPDWSLHDVCGERGLNILGLKGGPDYCAALFWWTMAANKTKCYGLHHHGPNPCLDHQVPWTISTFSQGYRAYGQANQWARHGIYDSWGRAYTGGTVAAQHFMGYENCAAAYHHNHPTPLDRVRAAVAQFARDIGLVPQWAKKLRQDPKNRS